jgi:two-component system response regulator AtoC
MKPVLLIVDDEESVRDSFRMVLQDEYDLIFAENAKSTLRILKSQTFDLCLLDIMLPDGSGLDLLRQMKRRDGSIDVIMVTALQGVETALSAMKGEALDYITKPFNIDELRGLIRKILARKVEHQSRLVKDNTQPARPLCLIGESKTARDLVKKIGTAAKTELPVCLIGEEGAGVEAVAREIHQGSRRKKEPFVTFDCSSADPAQLERELFGEEAAGQLQQIGKLEFAHKGTLFLKQIHQLPLAVQDQFMTILLDKALFRLEIGIRIPLDVRVITSSDTDLTAKAAESLFLKDFYQSLIHRHTFSVPSLRERKLDIPLLMEHLLKIANQRHKTPVKTISNEVIELLTDYPWPGNLSELENCIEVMVLFANKEVLTIEDIPLDILIKETDLGQTQLAEKISLKHLRRQFERKYIRKVLEDTSGNQTETAQRLEINRVTLNGKLNELGLKEDYKKIVQKRRARRDKGIKNV